MDGVETYVARANVSRFMDLLEHESDGPERLQLKKLLVAEEDRFGTQSERLVTAQLALDRCLERIREQRTRVANMDAEDPQFPMAKCLLLNLLDCLSVVRLHIDRLKRALE